MLTFTKHLFSITNMIIFADEMFINMLKLQSYLINSI